MEQNDAKKKIYPILVDKKLTIKKGRSIKDIQTGDSDLSDYPIGQIQTEHLIEH